MITVAKLRSLQTDTVVGVEAGELLALIGSPPEPGEALLTRPLAWRHRRYLAVREHALSTSGLPVADALCAQAAYVEGEARELHKAADMLATELDSPEPGDADWIEDRRRAARHEVADVVLSAVTLANILGVTVEDCIDEKTEADRGRG